MRASRYDAVLPCPVCDDGDCQICSDSGEFAYYAPAHPAERDRDVLIYYADPGDGIAEKHMMNAQRFDALAGNATIDPPRDDDGNLTVAQDKADRMQNQLGANAPYENDLSKDDFSDGWPSDPDLTPQEVVSWLRGRDAGLLADRLEQAFGYYESNS